MLSNNTNNTTTIPIYKSTTNKCSIIQHTNNNVCDNVCGNVCDNKYSLQLLFSDELFLRSIGNSNILNVTTINNTFTSIYFYASSIKSLESYLNELTNKLKITNNEGDNDEEDVYDDEEEKEPYILYDQSIQIISCLTKQQLFLENNGHGFFNITLNDIIVIDDHLFIYINPTFIKPFSTESYGQFHFYSPFIRNKYSSPELLAIDKLPASVSYKTFYYSLGALITSSCLFSGINNGINTNIDWLLILQPIIHTKLYWFLVRCLSNNYESRHLCLI
jgi:hypothetical protein